MPRIRRYIKPQTCYEICFRARSGLPLATQDLISFILGSILARTQRNDKVTLCHDLWNGSHAHLLVVARSAEQCVAFYAEIQKRITDAIKRLMGIEHCNLWEGYAMVAEVADVAKVIERIAYFYANPAQDNLVDKIEQYPGYSSWKDFLECKTSLIAKTEAKYPWIRLPTIPKLVSPHLTLEKNITLISLLKERNSEQHSLIREPNAWMKCFGIDSDKEVQEINDRILESLRAREEESRTKRNIDQKPLMGVSRLRAQPIMADHAPKGKSSKPYVLSSLRELRDEIKSAFKLFCETCKACYQEWRKGNFLVKWPPEAFRPPIPPDYHVP